VGIQKWVPVSVFNESPKKAKENPVDIEYDLLKGLSQNIVSFGWWC
jgi:hypothetical protein